VNYFVSTNPGGIYFSYSEQALNPKYRRDAPEVDWSDSRLDSLFENDVVGAPLPTPSLLNRLGFYGSMSNEKGDLSVVATVPFWLVTPIAAAPVLVVFAREVRRRRRAARNRCAVCGYDLTGNVSGVCPECGVTPPAGRSASAPSPPARGARPSS
jgi:hypothetical protein